jgi:hypothetical protein
MAARNRPSRHRLIHEGDYLFIVLPKALHLHQKHTWLHFIATNRVF